MDRFRIAIAQPRISHDPAVNGPVVRRIMRDAAGQGARLVLFPEGMLSGYAKAQHPSWDALDFDVVRAELRSVMALAAELRLWVVLGCTHQLTSPHLPHNSLYVISDAGAIVDRYDKRFCSGTETRLFYTPGTRPVVFDVDGVRFGCVTCVEINFPQLFTEYEVLGVDCLLLPSYPIDAEFEIKARAHAGINCYWVALAGPAQAAHHFPSELIGPNAKVLAAITPGTDLVVADLDPADPALDIALNAARPWRTVVSSGEFHRGARRDHDPRSLDRTGI